jgi:hypothetical protein
MVDYVPIEKGMTIRQPSTANLMIDSYDRTLATYPSAGDFQIQRNSSILNGFFTRIGTSEVVLEWGLPNVIAGFNRNFRVTIAGTEYEVLLSEGFYTVAAALDAIVALLNVKTGISGTYTFSIDTSGGVVNLKCVVTSGGAAQNYTLATSSTLLTQLGFVLNVSSNLQRVGAVRAPDLRIYRYLDIVSNQLTYAQNLKDATTATSSRDVLCRWYFDWTGVPVPDAYGFPIYQGYSGFTERRIFNPPKQIRWEPNLPIGNLGFQVYFNTSGTSGADILLNDTRFEWLMTLQVSEV